MIFKKSKFLSLLLAWFDRSRRDLPWRRPLDARVDTPLNAYFVFVSEAMLQQTQVSAVVPYFKRFINAFPTVNDLASADPTQVLRLWQGLGYYSRARNLHKAAQRIVEEFGGKVPDSVEKLLGLPGIGRYTAGAIASIAYNQLAPILDGNVARVLCRLDAIESDPREPVTREQLWQRAEEILPERSDRVGDINSALMELGATVCTPRNPQCLICPVSAFCQARERGIQDRIPPPKKAKPTPLHHRWTFCIHSKGKYLIEKRPDTGRWAGMWQFITIEANGQRPTPRTVQHSVGVSASVLQHAGTVSHALTHRRYKFDVYICEVKELSKSRATGERAWIRLDQINLYPFPKPHLKIVQMLAGDE